VIVHNLAHKILDPGGGPEALSHTPTTSVESRLA
jgi:hypothetical protein